MEFQGIYMNLRNFKEFQAILKNLKEYKGIGSPMLCGKFVF